RRAAAHAAPALGMAAQASDGRNAQHARSAAGLAASEGLGARGHAFLGVAADAEERAALRQGPLRRHGAARRPGGRGDEASPARGRSAAAGMTPPPAKPVVSGM